MTEEKGKKTRDQEGSIIKKIVERRSANGRTRKETVYVVRIRRNEYDESGNFVRQVQSKKQAVNYKDALSLRKQVREELEARVKARSKPISNTGKTFFELLDFFERNYVKPAVFANGKKIAGQKNPIRNTKRELAACKAFIPNHQASSIDYDMLFNFKEYMLSTPYKRRRKRLLAKDEVYKGEIITRGRQRWAVYYEYKSRKPATVHRYLSTLRRAFSVGVTHGFIEVNPFKKGDPLIVTSIEDVRERICSFDEEERILAVCVPPREHLRDVFICAIDTFARENELFSLKGSDVNFEDRYIRVLEMNAKVAKDRYIPLSDRAIEALLRIKGDRHGKEWLESDVFTFESITTSWYTALRIAEISDLRWHDLRATGITRMLDAGVPAPIVMGFSGHDKYETFKKYVRIDLDSIKQAAVAFSSNFSERKAERARDLRSPSDCSEKSISGIPEVTLKLDMIN